MLSPLIHEVSFGPLNETVHASDDIIPTLQIRKRSSEKPSFLAKVIQSAADPGLEQPSSASKPTLYLLTTA